MADRQAGDLSLCSVRLTSWHKSVRWPWGHCVHKVTMRSQWCEDLHYDDVQIILWQVDIILFDWLITTIRVRFLGFTIGVLDTSDLFWFALLSRDTLFHLKTQDVPEISVQASNMTSTTSSSPCHTCNLTSCEHPCWTHECSPVGRFRLMPS